MSTQPSKRKGDTNSTSDSTQSSKGQSTAKKSKRQTESVPFNHCATTPSDFCCNCHRQEHPSQPTLEIETVQKQQFPLGMFNKKFCNITSRDKQQEVTLCHCCRMYLLTKNMKKWMYVWAAWTWFAFSKHQVVTTHQAELWRYFPKTWRHWWLKPFRELHPCMKDITIDLPSPLFEDVTNECNEYDEAIHNGKLTDLMDQQNKHHYCSVRCPFGCSEFLYKAPGLEYDQIIRRYVDKITQCGSIGYKSGNTALSKRLEGGREDYFSTQMYGITELPVRRCIITTKSQGAMVLVCRDHKKGSPNKYFHPPTNPINGNMSAPIGDQLCHACLTPRIAKTMKAHKYCDTYQMSEVRGNYGGLDSCDLYENGRFDIQSKLMENNECLSLHERMDIQHLLNQMQSNNIVPPYLADEMRDKANLLNTDGIQNSLKGATFMTLKDCIALEKRMTTSYLSVDKYITDSGEQQEVKYKRKWPLSIINLHTLDGFGAQMPLISTFKELGCDSRCLWLLASLSTSIPEVWDQIADKITTRNEWYGHFLTKCAMSLNFKTTPEQSRYRKTNPYTHMRTPENLRKLINPINITDPGETIGYATQDLDSIGVFRASAIDHIPSEQKTTLKVIVLYQKQNTREYTALKNYIKTSNEAIWELRFVALTHPSMNTTKADEWNGTFFARHGGELFPDWWQQDKGETAIKCTNGLPNEITKKWQIATYVRMKCHEVDDLQNEYLRHIGSQSKAVCKDHQCPLTMATYGSKDLCSCKNTGNCKRRSYFECPIPNCPTYICKQHYEELLGINGRVEIPGDPSCHKELPDLMESDEESTLSDDDDYFLRDEEDGSPAQRETTNVDADIHYHEKVDPQDFFGYSSDDSSSDSSTCCDLAAAIDTHDESPSNTNQIAHNRSHYTSYVDPPDETGYDTESESSSIRSANNSATDIRASSPRNAATQATIPCTIPNNAPAPRITGRRFMINAKVLLNKQASLLIRKKNPLQASRGERGFLQRIVATAGDYSVPLVYPEGMLFPSIFWKGTQDGSIIGSIPNCLLAGNYNVKTQGFATVEEHVKCRIKNPSLLCGSDVRYIHLAFDMINNLRLRGFDQRVVLRRGFENFIGSSGKKVKDRESLLDLDQMDNREKVKQLAAMIRDEQPTYFYTHTCNQAEHFGVKPIRQWIEQKCNLISCNGILTPQEKQELQMATRQKAAFQLLRTWIEAGESWMNYIIHSPEQPLGRVKKHFWRWEFQDAEGNLPHMHALFWTHEHVSNPIERENIQNRVICSSKSLIAPNEFDAYIQEGLIDNIQDGFNTIDLASTIQHHDCAKGKFRCIRRTGVGDNDWKCRVRNHYLENPNPARYTFEELDPNHSEEVLELFKDMELCRKDIQSGHYFDFDPKLIGGKHMYPAVPDEHFVPCNPRLFIATKSSDNLQICDVYMSARYLAKYVAGFDQYYDVQLKAGQDGDNHIDVRGTTIANTKVTSSKINEQKRKKRADRDHPKPKARLISLTEQFFLMLGCKPVHTNMEFVQLCTLPLEQRPGLDHTPVIDDVITETDLDTIQPDCITAIRTRKELSLPMIRQFTTSQEKIMKDQLFSKVTIDKITAFGLRPPELIWVSNPTDYHRWFKRLPNEKALIIENRKYTTSQQLVERDISICGWVDGTDCQIKIRPPALKEIVNLPWKTEFAEIQQLLSVLHNKWYNHQNSTERLWTAQKLIFIEASYRDSTVPLPVYSSVPPTQPQRFLIHILLSLGKFSNEVELFQGGNMKTALQNAQLIPKINPGDPPLNIGHVLSITKRYIMEQLLFLPTGTKTFDRYCLLAHQVLQSAILHDEIPANDIPPYLYTTLQKQADETVKEHVRVNRQVLVRTLHAAIQPTDLPNLPTIEQFVNATKDEPLLWQPQLQPRPYQSTESFTSQVKALSILLEQIDQYCAPNGLYTKCPLAAGLPGSGKTFLFSIAILYAVSKGLITESSATMALRAIDLGGHHLHTLFALPPSGDESVQRYAELSIIRLFKNPKLIGFLRQLDVLAIDEFGQLSAETLSSLDIILRRIRDSNLLFGGVLIIGTLDHGQLPPIQGRPVLLSSHIFTSFRLTLCKGNFRARQCKVAQRVQDISRMETYTPELIDEFKSLLRDNCQFVQDWDDKNIRRDTVRVYAKKSGKEEAIRAFFRGLRNQNIQMVTRTAEDEETCSNSNGNWKSATPITVRRLNRNVREPEHLTLYKGAILEMTYNQTTGTTFSQSQLAVLCKLPSQSHLDGWKPFEAMLAPAGTSQIPMNVELTEQNLQNQGWTKIMIPIAPNRASNTFTNNYGRRKQYAVTPRIATTIHRSMGQTIPHMLTSVDETDAKFTLWMKEQVVVLLSRTPYLKNITFKGNKNDTVEYLAQLIQRRSQYMGYMTHLVATMDETTPTTVRCIQQSHLPFRLKDIGMPQGNNGFCYVMVSLKDYTTCYIGQTLNLQHRYNLHHAKLGAKQTANPFLRPWALLACVTGFNRDVHTMRSFEKRWQRLSRNTKQPGPQGCIDKANQLISWWNTKQQDLQLGLIIFYRIVPPAK